jgi:crotonobetainyl-CoA:carnitine CoA-transferase CaiB-like acyl-CoA transferase
VEIYAALEKWAEDKTRSQVVKILQDAGLLAEPVMNDREVYECEHYRERGTIRWLDDPSFGDILTQAGYSSGLMSKSPRRQNWIWRPVGADNVKIYHELLGYPTATIQEWYDKSWI